MNKLLELFKKTSVLNWDFYNHDYCGFDYQELENFAKIGSNLYLKTRIIRNPKKPKFFKCEFLVGPEYTECTLYSKGLHVFNLQELKNLDEVIIEKIFND